MKNHRHYAMCLRSNGHQMTKLWFKFMAMWFLSAIQQCLIFSVLSTYYVLGFTSYLWHPSCIQEEITTVTFPHMLLKIKVISRHTHTLMKYWGSTYNYFNWIVILHCIQYTLKLAEEFPSLKMIVIKIIKYSIQFLACRR